MSKTEKTNAGEVVTLRDVEKVIKGWRSSCEMRGEIPNGVYNFISLSRNYELSHETQMRAFGDEGIVLALHGDNSNALIPGISKGSGSKKMIEYKGVDFNPY